MESTTFLIDLFTDTAAILNSIVLTEKLWTAEGAIAGKFIVYTAFRINFYCLFLIAELQRAKRASEAPWVRKIGNPSS